MFGVFGLVGLIVFIYLKPQEFIPALERLPFLYLFLALTVFGLALDLRAKHIRLEKGPHLPYMVAFFLWCMITAFAKTGGSGLTPSIIQLSIALTLYVLVSTAVQTFKVYEVVVHTIPRRYAAGIHIAKPPEPREEAPFKPTFVVKSLAHVRSAAQATGGHLKPESGAWHFRGHIVLDGWDPEGNIVQFKQVE